MKGIALTVFLLGSAALGMTQDQATAAHRTLRILTYNIHHGEGMDGAFDLERLAGIINATHPDLVSIQEVDEGTRRSDGVHQLRELGRLTGLTPTFGQAMDFEGGGYGVGILSRWKPQSIENRALPVTPDREPRTMLTAVIIPGPHWPRLAFTSTHFDSGREADQRTAQAIAINDRLRDEPGTLRILAGDFNSGPDTDVTATLKTRWTEVSAADRPTLSISGRLSFRVDYIFVDQPSRWRVVESQVIEDRIASDHRPVLAVLELVDDTN
jgi:endonuclease/exonuclease/phosphatase family metal-dependent hydrolase